MLHVNLRYVQGDEEYSGDEVLYSSRVDMQLFRATPVSIYFNLKIFIFFHMPLFSICTHFVNVFEKTSVYPIFYIAIDIITTRLPMMIEILNKPFSSIFISQIMSCDIFVDIVAKS